MNPKPITIDGVVYNPAQQGDEVRIVIGQRGWVWVGWWSQSDTEVPLTGARNVRTWGTTKGLGELAAGPTAATVLDPAGTVRLHELAVVASYAASTDGWREHLA